MVPTVTAAWLTLHRNSITATPTTDCDPDGLTRGGLEPPKGTPTSN